MVQAATLDVDFENELSSKLKAEYLSVLVNLIVCLNFKRRKRRLQRLETTMYVWEAHQFVRDVKTVIIDSLFYLSQVKQGLRSYVCKYDVHGQPATSYPVSDKLYLSLSCNRLLSSKEF